MSRYLPLFLLILSLSSLQAEDEVVKASSFGFNPDDSTTALQAAINSGAKKVIVENVGKPWIVHSIQLASHQEIVFEDGVVVQAKRGAFKNRSDSLLTGDGLTDIALTGSGATLKMWKEDYDDESRYQHSEWRHLLKLRSCQRVRIEGLTLADSGGDGIYLGSSGDGPCVDFVIKDVICDNNYRQGISVISARNLRIENVVLKNTGGTAPKAGIDFEPNRPGNELVNCVMRNCISENNEGSGYVLSLRALDATSEPVSLRIENCRATGNRESIRIKLNGDSEASGVRGAIDIVDCVFERGRNAGVSVTDKPIAAATVRFQNCKIIEPAIHSPDIAPVLLATSTSSTADVGNLHFENCVIEDSLNRPIASFTDMGGGLSLQDVTGTFTVNGIPTELDTASIPQSRPKVFPPFSTEGISYEPVVAAGTFLEKKPSRAQQRGVADWLIWAKSGDEATFGLYVRVLGGTDALPKLQVTAPSGKKVKLTQMEQAEDREGFAYTFVAEETGAYQIHSLQRKQVVRVYSETHPLCLYSESGRFRFFRTRGEYFFWVPPHAKEFAIRAAGDNLGERLKAALVDPSGKVVEEVDNIAAAHQFTVSSDDSEGEIWSIRISHPSDYHMEDFVIRLLGLPPILSHSKEALLRPTIGNE